MIKKYYSYGLETNSKYYFQIAASNDLGRSSFSLIASLTTAPSISFLKHVAHAMWIAGPVVIINY